MKNERDPNGIGQHEPGAKLDEGKLRVDLVLGSFARAITQVASVGTYGASKYSPQGWLHVPQGIERYADAAGRHYLRRKTGELRDPDTGLLHLAHECWNKLAELELWLRENEQRDVHGGSGDSAARSCSHGLSRREEFLSGRSLPDVFD